MIKSLDCINEVEKYDLLTCLDSMPNIQSFVTAISPQRILLLMIVDITLLTGYQQDKVMQV